jgi:hypothetical protein
VICGNPLTVHETEWIRGLDQVDPAFLINYHPTHPGCRKKLIERVVLMRSPAFYP